MDLGAVMMQSGRFKSPDKSPDLPQPPNRRLPNMQAPVEIPPRRLDSIEIGRLSHCGRSTSHVAPLEPRDWPWTKRKGLHGLHLPCALRSHHFTSPLSQSPNPPRPQPVNGPSGYRVSNFISCFALDGAERPFGARRHHHEFSSGSCCRRFVLRRLGFRMGWNSFRGAVRRWREGTNSGPPRSLFRGGSSEECCNVGAEMHATGVKIICRC
ncbi:hypothetical protein P152DRAFT_252313 [Eremomyces bilateralis CBS 781.70]|uniref:Uncharacterized protein n=1 Tax=Eremomyces bilateralis CBS 781.70 TaxID=1392243 RepID=A0A6G1FQZ8_9PEZI|nr:uncharacterized protein P152DRAFT_252313 [Eremomyces bilateralis CBS 781.70]KAF1808207.1 hypothetical protein P152DRAFT_252313 [Eremomyces bilateralis CBS 781.70]